MALIDNNNRDWAFSKGATPLEGMQLVIFDDYKDEFEFVEAHPEWVYEHQDEDKKNFKRWIIIPKDKTIPAIKAMKESFADGAKIYIREIVPEQKMNIDDFVKHVSEGLENDEGFFHYKPQVTVYIDFRNEDGLKMIDYSCLPF